MNKNKTNNLKNVLAKHIKDNIKEYIIVALMFIIGIFLGVLFINNTKEAQTAEITTYFNNFITKFKETQNINSMQMLKESIGQDILLACAIWFFGTTIIGIPIVFGIVLFRGFCLGYTISTCIAIMGFSKGILFVLIALLIQNVIFIQALIAIAVSGFKLYKSIMKDKRKENIKLEIVRHTVFSIIMLIFFIISSVAEVLISSNILKGVIKYF